MKQFVWALSAALLMGGSVAAWAQAPGTSQSQMRGDMGDHPHQGSQPGSKRPMAKDREDPQMRGEMGDHPHQASGAGSKRPTSRSKEDPRMRGEMGDHPHTNSTTGRK